MSTPRHPASPAARERIVLGVIGGSGLYDMPGLRVQRELKCATPWGEPSGPLIEATVDRDGGEPLRVLFVARHGAGHRLAPSEINYRANLHALKQLGVTHVVGVSAVGSLREDIAPGDLIVVDQFIDRTRGRSSTFFGEGVVAHVQFAEPTTPGLRTRLMAAARTATDKRIHERGTCIVMEGPAFSTRAESQMYRAWGADIIGMTALPEAKLAREAEMAYALLALSTDYDGWHESEEEVSAEAVVAVMKANVEAARDSVLALARALPGSTRECPPPRALEGAIMTDPSTISPAMKDRLDLLAGHYWLETTDP